MDEGENPKSNPFSFKQVVFLHLHLLHLSRIIRSLDNGHIRHWIVISMHKLGSFKGKMKALLKRCGHEV